MSKLIILKTTKYGEADLIVKGLTTDGSCLSFIAKSALRSRKRFGGGVLEPTHFISASYKEVGFDSDKLPVLQEAKLLEEFQGLRADYDRLEVALYMLQLVDRVSQEGEIGERSIFDLLGHALRAAEKSQHLGLLRTQFELKLLNQQGVLPPELADGDFLTPTIRDHESIDLPKQRLNAMRSALSSVIQQYIHQ